MEDSLKNKALKGASWSFADNISNSGITFIVGIVLARILSPAEFGIIGMITIFIAISNSIMDSGFSSALIRKQDATQIDYNTVFYFNLCISLLLFIILYLLAPLISNFYETPILSNVLRVMSLILIINAFSIVQRTLLIKNVDFKTQTKASLISSVLSGFVGIFMAMKGFGVWSLVWQQLSRQIIYSGMLWLFANWRPRLIFSTKSFKNLFGFGSKLLISGLIDTIYNNVYYIIIGKFYTANQLGQYTRAEQFNSIFSTNLTTAVQRVSYPILSKLQADQDRLKDAFRRVIKITMLYTFYCMFTIVAIAKPLIMTLIGDKWIEAAEYLQIIGFYGMLYPLHAININLLQVKGRSDLMLKLEIIKKIISIPPIILGIFLGIEIMLAGAVVVSIISFFLNSKYAGKLINYSSFKQIKDIFPFFIFSFIAAIITYSISSLDSTPQILLLLQLLFSTAFFIIYCEYKNLEEYKIIKHLVLSILKIRK